jgi:lipopolysaccharide biosynthesis glycosyltransferase
MYISYIADKNYSDYLLVSLFSLLQNNQPTRIFVIVDFENKKFNRQIDKLSKRNKIPIEVIQIDKKSIESQIPDAIATTQYTHAKISNYYRLFLEDFIPPHVDNLLYLDCDTVIDGSIFELWNNNIDEFYFGAIRDSGVNYSSYLKTFNLTSLNYFNTGVLLFNLRKLRNDKFKGKCIDFIKTNYNRIQFWDQDVINVIANGKIKELSYEYNFQSFCLSLKLKKRPIVIHFTGNGNKPFDSNRIKNEYEFLFWKYARSFGFNKLYYYKRVKFLFAKVYQKKVSVKDLVAKPRLKKVKENYFSIQDSYLDLLINKTGEYVVNSGPFSGLKYFTPRSFGSSIYPKLLGIYEAELHCLIDRLKGRNYKKIIDIGCAEGYYAVGFARMFPDAQIVAVDNNIKALEFCKEMSKFNGVSQQMFFLEDITHAWFETESIKAEKCLIFCDCEGHEKTLFSVFNAGNLKKTDLIIEIHSFIDRKIATTLIGVFQDTHRINFITSLNDDFKVLNYRNSKIENLTFEQRKVLLAENRPEVMEWIYLESTCSAL